MGSRGLFCSEVLVPELVVAHPGFDLVVGHGEIALLLVRYVVFSRRRARRK